MKKNTTSLRRTLYACLLFMAGILPGLAAAANDIEGIVAVVDDRLIMQSDLDARMRALGIDPQDHAKAAQALNMMVEDIVVEKTYNKFGFPAPDSAQVTAVAEQNKISYYTARTFLMRRALMDTMVSNRVVVTPGMIKSQYDTSARYAGRPALHLKQLVLGQDKERAGQALAALKSGKSLEAVATEYGAQAGDSILDLGWVALDDLEPGVRDALAQAKDGDVAGPVEIKGDLCLFKVFGQDIKDRRELDEVRPEIVSSLENKQRDEAFAHWLKQIMAEYYIGIYF